MHAIMHTAAPPLHLHGVELPATIALEIQRIVDKCLAKDPDDRYQGMRDLVVDLRPLAAASMSILPGADAPSAGHGRPGAKEPGALAGRRGIAGVACRGGVLVYSAQYRAPIAEATATRPSVAVMYFENNTGDKEMDWLRTASPTCW